ncbi:MAG: hypothetical protein N2316_03220 [Spirochaetes bacterium]|nr:hypothetical protein [Spirochaetota bacterium]
MLYLSIFFLIVGIALIVISVISRSQVKSNSRVPSHEKAKADDIAPGKKEFMQRSASCESVRQQRSEKGSEQNLKGERVKASSTHMLHTPNISSGQKKVLGEQTKDFSSEKTQEYSANKFSAVLYYDSSGVVDYESGKSSIDPTFKKYSKLKRIGSGYVSVFSDAIHFQMRKKLFRFEFYLIEKIVQGDNYVAIFLKGSDEVRLFIFKRGSNVEKNIAREFVEYKKRKM